MNRKGAWLLAVLLAVLRGIPARAVELEAAYGCDLIREDNAVLSPYGLLHRADYQPMLSPVQKASEANMAMR